MLAQIDFQIVFLSRGKQIRIFCQHFLSIWDFFQDFWIFLGIFGFFRGLFFGFFLNVSKNFLNCLPRRIISKDKAWERTDYELITKKDPIEGCQQ